MTPPAPSPRLRPEWGLRDTFGHWIVLRSWDVAPSEEVVRDPLCISARLGHWLSDPICQPVLLRLCRELWGPQDYRPDYAVRRPSLLVRLAGEFRCGRLVLVAPKLEGSAPSGIAAAGSTQPAALTGVAAAEARRAALKQNDASRQAQKLAAKEKTWVGIRLRDENGKPVPNERYRVVLPDGSVHEGTLNSKGEVQFYEIDPGQCQISFPNIHQKEWKPA